MPVAASAIGTGHPCALLTQAEVTNAIGEPANPGYDAGHGGPCTYGVTGDVAAGALVVVSTWQQIDTAASAAGLTRSPVNGIGDEAWTAFGSTGQGYPAVLVRKGTIGFEVSIHGPNVFSTPDHGLAKEEALAALILPRL